MSLIIPGQSSAAMGQSPEIIQTPTGIVYRFTQNTKPIQRSPGVPLGIGDQWEKSDDGTEWFWNGTYWLSTVAQRSRVSTFINPGSLTISNGQSFFTGIGVVPVPALVGTSILIESIVGYMQGSPVFSGALNAGNFLTPILSSLGSINLAPVNNLSLLSTTTPLNLLGTPVVHTLSVSTAGTTLGSPILHNVTGSPSLSWTNGFNWTVFSQFRVITT